MDYRTFTVSAVLALGVMGVTPICRADIVASDGGIAVRDAGVAAPSRGMTMTQVAGKFGDPLTKVAAVGNPPISRWEYSGFVVYFERDHVIHAVVSASGPTDSSGAAAAPPPATPAPAAPPAAAAPAPEPNPAAAPVQEAPVAQASVTQASVTRAPVTQASVTPASAAPATAAIEAPPVAPAAAASAPVESEATAQP
jgi:hypothetical protein